jgi:hypothetical protein
MAEDTHEQESPPTLYPQISDESGLLASETDRVLNILDFEINRITVDEKRPGWTIWALFGAMGTIAWLLISEWERSQVSTTKVLQMFLAFSLVLESTGFIRIFANESETDTGPFFRFRLTSQVFSRPTIVIWLSKCLGSISIAIVASRGVWWPQLGIVVLLQTFGVTLMIFLLVQNLRNDPTGVGGRLLRGSKIAVLLGFLVSALIAALTVWAASGYFFSAVSQLPKEMIMSCLKIGVLLVALVFVLEKFVGESKPQPLLADLLRVRRDLVFGRIDLRAAIRQADIVLDGMEAEDLFQKEISQILEARALLLSKVQELQSSFGDERVRESSNELSSIPETEIDNTLADINSLKDTLKNQLFDLRKRVKRFISYTPAAYPLMTGLIHKIEHSINLVVWEVEPKLQAISELRAQIASDAGDKT